MDNIISAASALFIYFFEEIYEYPTYFEQNFIFEP